MILNGRFEVEKAEEGASVFYNGQKIGVLERDTRNLGMHPFQRGIAEMESETEIEIPQKPRKNRGYKSPRYAVTSKGDSDAAHKKVCWIVRLAPYIPHPQCNSCGGTGVYWQEGVPQPCHCYELSPESEPYLTLEYGATMGKLKGGGVKK